MSALLTLDAAGYLAGVAQIASPNCDARPEGMAVELLVIHNISLPPGRFGGSGVVELFTNRLDPDADPYFRAIAAMRVSAHFLIRRDGTVLQFVPTEMRAWHAGASNWRGRPRCNDFSVGIELEGSDDVAFEPAQYNVLAALARTLCDRYAIADIVGHSDIAPGRKTDPGPAFDWARLRAAVAGAHGAPAR